MIEQKTIWLNDGENSFSFKYCEIEELRAKVKECDIFIGKNVSIGNFVFISVGVRIGNNVVIGNDVSILDNATIRSNTYIEDETHIGVGETI